ncbi:hypothetical protein F183_A04790 [Bryobacterales bacterium F-183]|nr:hypothetical protein F183_A04790 [Bryobacterales bacterium F-183]
MEELRGFPAPVIDRATVERMFQVRRRRANQILARMGGYQVGRTGLVERHIFVANLEAIAAGEEFHYEQRRRVRVHEKLAEARRIARAKQVKIQPAAPVPAGPKLPSGVSIAPGEIRIAFDTPETLLTRLFELSQTIANDYEEFVAKLPQQQ